MDTIEAIQTKLAQSNPSHLLVQDESHQHHVPKNTITHVRVEMVSDHFKEMSLVKRHQWVYQTLRDIMPTIHALSLHTFAPSEWTGATHATPTCKGGFKHG